MFVKLQKIKKLTFFRARLRQKRRFLEVFARKREKIFKFHATGALKWPLLRGKRGKFLGFQNLGGGQWPGLFLGANLNKMTWFSALPSKKFLKVYTAKIDILPYKYKKINLFLLQKF